jgi:hypothetical protein
MFVSDVSCLVVVALAILHLSLSGLLIMLFLSYFEKKKRNGRGIGAKDQKKM